jgi:hypothetical protein
VVDGVRLGEDCVVGVSLLEVFTEGAVEPKLKPPVDEEAFVDEVFPSFLSVVVAEAPLALPKLNVVAGRDPAVAPPNNEELEPDAEALVDGAFSSFLSTADAAEAEVPLALPNENDGAGAELAVAETPPNKEEVEPDAEALVDGIFPSFLSVVPPLALPKLKVGAGAELAVAEAPPNKEELKPDDEGGGFVDGAVPSFLSVAVVFGSENNVVGAAEKEGMEIDAEVPAAAPLVAPNEKLEVLLGAASDFFESV